MTTRSAQPAVTDETYKKMLKEIDDSKASFELRVEKMKRFLETLEKKHCEQNSELLMKLFIHDISCLKNVEYDVNNIITVDLSGL